MFDRLRVLCASRRGLLSLFTLLAVFALSTAVAVAVPGDDESSSPASSETGTEASSPPEEPSAGSPKSEPGTAGNDGSVDDKSKSRDDGDREQIEPPTKRERRIPDHYIVVYERSVGDVDEETEKREREGFKSDLRYEKAIKGFSAKLSRPQLERLESDPEVAFITPDRQVKASSSEPLVSGEPTPPSGVRRIEAATETTTRQASGAGVAVVDTGIDLGHPDLNASSGKNCVSPGSAAQDDNGHGTHVAGTIAAENNGSGVVGVAPGTKLHAVKVLDSNGSGSLSSVICGIDWVTTNASALGIKVANMSLGGPGSPLESCATTTDAEHKAICNSTKAGITYVVAAGNAGYDFDYGPSPDTPAVYPEVLTVTAASDSDGQGGGVGGSPSCRSGESDDKHASFSNFATTSTGQAHTIAAPGVCIKSSAMGGGTTTMSGTSMASPHMAGALALCLDEAGQSGPCAGKAPSEIVQTMRSAAESHTAGTSGYGFFGDPTRPISGEYFGYLGWANSAADTVGDGTSPTVSSVSPTGDAIGVSGGANVAVTFSEPMDRASVQASFSLTAAGQTTPAAGTFAWSGNTMTFDPSATLAQGKTYTGRISTGARDASGRALASEKSWRFTTKDFSDAQVRQTGGSRATSATNPPRLNSDNNVFYQLNSSTSGTRTTAWYGRFLGVPAALRDLSVTYKGKNSASCTQTLAVWDWTANSGSGTWVTLDSRSVGTTEVGITKAPTGTLARFVGGPAGDELRVRVRCTRGSNFYSSGDLLEVGYGRP